MRSDRSAADLEARAAFFRALGHPARLVILNLIRMKPRHGQELAAILSLKPATISHHLAKLADAGLLTSQKDQYYQVYSLTGAMMDKPLGEIVSMPQAGIAERAEEDAYRAKVFRAFLKHGRLKRIPSQLKKRQVILERIIEEFEPDRDYTEREVNRTLVEWHEDVATLRREMVGLSLMTRSRGIYRRNVG
jgi:ArsR family transcriptional regulator